MPKKQLVMAGCQRDTDQILGLFYRGLQLSPQWNETTFENRVLQDINFVDRLKRGRVSPRKMMVAFRKLTEYIENNGKA